MASLCWRCTYTQRGCHAELCYHASRGGGAPCLFKCGPRRSSMNETTWPKHRLTSGASDQRLKQAGKEGRSGFMYVALRRKDTHAFLHRVSPHPGPTNHRWTHNLRGAKVAWFDFWWVGLVINQAFAFLSKVLNVAVLFCWVCAAALLRHRRAGARRSSRRNSPAAPPGRWCWIIPVRPSSALWAAAGRAGRSERKSHADRPSNRPAGAFPP